MTFTLKLTKLKATLNFPQYRLPYWLGNKFRGGFGSVLLKAVCGYLQPKCNECNGKDDCLYYALYQRDRQKRGKSQPVRPIVFIPPFFGKSISGKGKMDVDINVFGDYIRYLPHIIYGLRFLGKIGLNRDSKYILEKIVNYFTREVIYDGDSILVDKVKPVDISKISGDFDEFVRVNFITPVEVQRTPFNLEHLLYMIRQRLIFFVNEYGEGNVPEYLCEDTITDSKLKKHKLVHTSKRFGKRRFFGYTGHIDYRIINIDENAQKFIEIGKLIGAGAKSSFGMGFFNTEILK